PDYDRRGAADRLHRLLFEPRGIVLGQALRRLDARYRADPDHRLVQPEAARPRPHLRGGEMMLEAMPRTMEGRCGRSSVLSPLLQYRIHTSSDVPGGGALLSRAGRGYGALVCAADL